MTERASLVQVSQLGIESTYGTAVAATKRLQTIMLSPGTKTQVKLYRPSGAKFSTVSAQGKEWSEMSIAGTPSYGELPYLLSSFLGTTTPSATGANGAQKWVFSPTTYGPDTHTSFTLEHGSSVRGEQFAGMVVPGLGIKFTRDSIDLSGSAFAQRMTDPFTLTTLAATNEVQTATIGGAPTGGTFALTVSVPWAGTPQTASAIAYNATGATVQAALLALSNVGAGNLSVTGAAGGPYVITFLAALSGQPLPLITSTNSFTGGTSPAVTLAHTTPGVAIVAEPYAIKPLIPTQIDCYIDASSGGLGGTQYTRAFEVDWNITDYLAQIWPLQSTLGSFAAFVEKESKPDFKVKLEADSQGMGQIANLRSGATQFIRLQATGPSIDGTVTGLAQFDFAVKVKDISPFSDLGGVYCVEYTAQVVHDNGWGKALNFTIQNALAAL